MPRPFDAVLKAEQPAQVALACDVISPVLLRRKNETVRQEHLENLPSLFHRSAQQIPDVRQVVLDQGHVAFKLLVTRSHLGSCDFPLQGGDLGFPVLDGSE